jgi:DNA-binding phage protein
MASLVGDLFKEFGVTRQTLYRHIAPDGVLREDGGKLLKKTLTGFIVRFVRRPLELHGKNVGATAIAKQLGIGRSTVYKLLANN